MAKRSSRRWYEMKYKGHIQDERTADLFGDNPEAEEEFCEAMRELVKAWPIWGFRCSGKPYITNRDEMDGDGSQ